MIDVVIIVIGAALPSLPLVVLVTRADRIRVTIDALQRERDFGSLSQEQFDERRHKLLHRSLWRRWKKSSQSPIPTRENGT